MAKTTLNGWSVQRLTDFGRTRLSKSFYMREFLYSEISQIEQIPNLPDKPDLAIKAGKRLCEEILEPIQDALGRISVRSAYRAPAVNAKGAENGNQYSCATDNDAEHIWDHPQNDFMGATACVVVTSFVPYYERTGDWPALAWWIHENVPAYASMFFFKNLAAFNIQWFEDPKFPKSIQTTVPNPANGKKTALVLNGKPAFPGPYKAFYQEYLEAIRGGLESTRGNV
jgi:hypothetical protein